MLPADTTSATKGNVAGHGPPCTVIVPESGNSPSALGMVDCESTAETVAVAPETGRPVFGFMTLRTPV